MAEETTTQQQELIDEIMAKLQEASLNVDELEVIETMAGVRRIPVVRGRKLVTAPLTLLSEQLSGDEEINIDYVTEMI